MLEIPKASIVKEVEFVNNCKIGFGVIIKGGLTIWETETELEFPPKLETWANKYPVSFRLKFEQMIWLESKK